MRISPPTLLLVLIATQTAVAVFLYGLPGLGGTFRDAYGLSLTETGLILGAPAAGLTVALLGWGALGDRIGERRPLPAGMALAAVGCVVAATADSGRQTALGLMIAGVGGASITLCSRVATAVVAPERRALALSALMMALSLGGVVASLAFVPLERAGGLPAPFWATAAACAAVALVLARTLPAGTARPTPAGREPARPYRLPDVWRISLGSAGTMLGGVALLAFLPVFLIDRHGWSSTDAAVLLAGVFGAAGIARVALGWRADRTGRRARPALALAVATVILTVALALSADAPEAVVVALLAAAIVVATANVGLTATMLAGTVDLRARGRALALRQTVVYLGVSLAAPLMGLLADGLGWHAAFGVVAVAPLASWILLAPFARAERLTPAWRTARD